jgi:hypothetical protein
LSARVKRDVWMDGWCSVGGERASATMTDGGDATTRRRLRINERKHFCGNARRKRRSRWTSYS